MQARGAYDLVHAFLRAFVAPAKRGDSYARTRDTPESRSGQTCVIDGVEGTMVAGQSEHKGPDPHAEATSDLCTEELMPQIAHHGDSGSSSCASFVAVMPRKGVVQPQETNAAFVKVPTRGVIKRLARSSQPKLEAVKLLPRRGVICSSVCKVSCSADTVIPVLPRRCGPTLAVSTLFNNAATIHKQILQRIRRCRLTLV
jgi:hypothetical protein